MDQSGSSKLASVDVAIRVVTEAEAAAASIMVYESFAQLASGDWEAHAAGFPGGFVAREMGGQD
jgi:hypothetical protein